MMQFPYRRDYYEGESNIAGDTLSRNLAIPNTKERQENYLTALEEDWSCEETLGSFSELPYTELCAPLSDEAIRKAATFKLRRNRTIAGAHNARVGHHGIDKTMKKLIRAKSIWPGMQRDVIDFIEKCPLCQKMKPLKVPIVTTPFTTAAYSLNQKIMIDTIGPLPESDEGYRFIMVVIDCFSRYVELYALKEVTALATARKLLEHFARNGTPGIIQTDQGTQFVNELINELVLLLGTETTAILAHSKEENAIVERVNKEVMRHLRALVYEIAKQRNEWPHLVPLPQRICNSEIVESTGVSPNDLKFGGAVNLDSGFLIPVEAVPSQTNLSEWSQKVLETQAKLIKLAQLRQRSVDEKHVEERSKGDITVFPPNSFVLVRPPWSAMGYRPSSKLHTDWRGPLRVVNNTGAQYTLFNMVTAKIEQIHVTRLKPFDYEPSLVDPLKLAAADYDEFIIERVLDHAGDPRRKSSLDFLVKWEGYDDCENLWIPWKEARLNAKVHEYLRSKGMERLIPV
jgi:hypothetical protein